MRRLPGAPIVYFLQEGRRSDYFLPRLEYEVLNAAQDRILDPAWKERYRIRAGIEGTPSQGVRSVGLRRSRDIGQAKTGLQHVCVAAAMNASHAVHWLTETPRPEHARRGLQLWPQLPGSPTVSR